MFRIRFRKKKWWWAFYSWSLNVSAVNAWRLRQKVTGKKESYLDFLWELVVGLLTVYGTPSSRQRRPMESLPSAVVESLR